MNALCGTSVVLIILFGVLSACSEGTEVAPAANDEIVKNLDQEQLDALCAQTQQAGLAYLARHQANMCGVAALAAEEFNELDCAEEYDKCMAIDIQTELIELCIAAEPGLYFGGCACGWDKASTPVFNCHDTVTEFEACLAEVYQAMEQIHDEFAVSCADKGSAEDHWIQAGYNQPDCINQIPSSCSLVVAELSWSYMPDSLYQILVGPSGP